MRAVQADSVLRGLEKHSGGVYTMAWASLLLALLAHCTGQGGLSGLRGGGWE